ncbi:hypothetical protein T03_726 [Trichinella britovi]|uniref:Uncharacterized protein n=1 Tax=Trichinella britovi TaxID=45882 RepID=A0A0V0YRD4_TRIBR|nr:hypothetical protein T03_726 [Trichinella britovi]
MDARKQMSYLTKARLGPLSSSGMASVRRSQYSAP